jgi:hypothetical protein
MKYIKTFESIKNFKVGDYVFITKLSKHLPLYKQLVKISKELFKMGKASTKTWSLHSIEDDFVGAWTSDRIRKATKKEIADYMLKINREKYNI